MSSVRHDPARPSAIAIVFDALAEAAPDEDTYPTSCPRQPVPIGAVADLLAKNALAAGGLEPVELGLQRLSDGRDASISEGRFHVQFPPYIMQGLTH